MQVLLERGIRRLLEVAREGRAPEPWPRVHAFNTLSAVFNDRGLALHLSAFTADGVALHSSHPPTFVLLICSPAFLDTDIVLSNLAVQYKP